MESNIQTKAGVDPTQVQALEEKVRDLEKRLRDVEERAPEDRVSLIVFSGDFRPRSGGLRYRHRRRSDGPAGEHVLHLLGLSVLRKGRQLSGRPSSKR